MPTPRKVISELTPAKGQRVVIIPFSDTAYYERVSWYKNDKTSPHARLQTRYYFCVYLVNGTDAIPSDFYAMNAPEGLASRILEMPDYENSIVCISRPNKKRFDGTMPEPMTEEVRAKVERLRYRLFTLARLQEQFPSVQSTPGIAAPIKVNPAPEEASDEPENITAESPEDLDTSSELKSHFVSAFKRKKERGNQSAIDFLRNLPTCSLPPGYSRDDERVKSVRERFGRAAVYMVDWTEDILVLQLDRIADINRVQSCLDKRTRKELNNLGSAIRDNPAKMKSTFYQTLYQMIDKTRAKMSD